MTITWLGQAGLLFEENGFTAMIDPYLSDSVAKLDAAKARRVPVEERFFEITPDILAFTHDHLDHYDTETAPRFLERTDKQMIVLAPTSVWEKAHTHAQCHNYVQFNPATSWTEGPFRFTAVPAAHSDPYAIGILVEAGGKCYYVTGDTLYNEAIFPFLPREIEAIFLPINGVGNNMNMWDAARFATRTGAKRVVPLHFGLFDSLDPNAMPCEDLVIPQFYKEIKIEA